MSNQDFSSISQLYGKQALKLISEAHVLIIGIGGVGSWAAEALARTGIGKLTLVDMDDICSSNINRQVHALISTVGKTKVSEMTERISQINPNCDVTPIHDFYSEQTSSSILNKKYDYIIDAFDSIDKKCHLISRCKELAIPLIVTGAAGGKKDPSAIAISDLNLSFNDGLLLKVRKKLKANYGFPKYEKKKFKISCVFSSETVQKKEGAVGVNCRSGLGTTSFVTATFGMFAAAHVIEHIISQNEN